MLNHSKEGNQRSHLYKKRETRKICEPHQQTTTTEHQVSDLVQLKTKQRVQTFNRNQPSTLPETKVKHHNIERHAMKYQLKWLNSIKRHINTLNEYI